jgi:tRNA(Ile)-lysidine synthase
MRAVSGRRLRPLLDVRRADLHRAAESIAPGALSDAARDPMNDDVDLARVRLRRDVLPALREIAPDPVGALARLAELARAEGAMLDETVAALRLTLPVVTFGAAALVPSAALRALPEALGRRVVRTMLPEGEARSATSVERVLRAPDGWRATLPGPLDVSVDRGWHVVLPAVLPAAPAPPAGEPLRATLVHAASGMTLRRVPAPATDSTPAGPLLAAEPSGGLPPGLDATRLTVRLRAAEELRVRGRRDGDRVRTAGGTRTLGDVLAEAGVPLALRDLLPVVVGADDRTLWVPGVVVDVAAHDGPVEVAD